MNNIKSFHSIFRIVLYITALIVFSLSLWNFSLEDKKQIILFLVTLGASVTLIFMSISAGGGSIDLSDTIIGLVFFITKDIAATTVFAGLNFIISGIINERYITYQRDKSKKYFNASMHTVITYLTSLAGGVLLHQLPDTKFFFVMTYSIVFIGVYLILNILFIKAEYSILLGRNFKFDEDSKKLLMTNFVVSVMVTTTLCVITGSDILGTVLVLGNLIILQYCFYIFRKLQIRNDAIKGLLDITRNIVKYGDFRDKCKHLIVSLKELIPYTICAVYTFDTENDVMTYPIAYNGPEDIDIGELRLNLSGESVSAKTIREGKTYISKDISKDKKVKITGKLAEVSAAMIFVPIVIGEKVVGAIILGGREDLVNFANNGIDDILNILSNQMALAIDNDSFYRNIKNKADRDHLTKLFNRRVFDREMDELLTNNVPFSLVMYDLDDFKVVNDTYGHLSGDKALKMVSEIIWKSVRKTDVPCRFGGEELVIIFKDLSKEDAYIISERIRENIETTPIMVGNKEVFITISGGVSSYPEDGRTKDEVIEAADCILYSECKAKGKNRVHAHNLKNHSSVVSN